VYEVVYYTAVKYSQKDNEMSFQRADKRTIRWMCGVKVTDRFSYRVDKETMRR